LYFYASIVQLENAIGHCQTDAAAASFGCEVEVKDFFAYVVGDSRPLIGNAEHSEFAFFLQDDAKGSAIGHGLRAVLDNVEGGLLDEVGVDVDEHGALGHVAYEGDVMSRKFCGRKGEDTADHGSKVLLTQLEFDGAAEIYE
jgi:hypothetical protein